MQEKCLFRMILILFLLSVLNGFKISIQEDCKPFAPRLNLGLHFYNQQSPEMIGVRFNTKQECNNSFVMIQKSPTYIVKIPCETDSFVLGSYTGYIHKCSIEKLSYGESYSYMVYGWSGLGSNAPIPFERNFIKTHLINIDTQVKLVILADWGYLRAKAGIYDPLDQAFKTMLQMNQNIDGIYIGGDIAYDLDSYEGQYYEDFIIMLSQVGSRWPVILNNGNHEHLTVEDQIISKASFQLYGSIENRITVINLPFINLFMFDPYRIIFKGEDPTELATQFQQKLKQLSLNSPSKPVIACSHYPYRCNGNIPDCYDVRQKLTPFFAKMMQYNVALYMGAHYHTYERVYPYYFNETFLKKESPYIWTQGGASDYLDNTLLSIVEGIAGNDRQIIKEYPPDEPFTAAHVINNTGFGVMTVRVSGLEYRHVINKDAYKALDEWQILFERPKDEQKDEKEKEWKA